MKTAKLRSFIKAITFRVVATLTTIVVFYFFTGRLDVALVAGGVDTVLKIIIYYFHERVWDGIEFGQAVLD